VTSKHSLHCADCLEFLPTLRAKSVDAIITDPPFTFAGGLSNGRASMADSQFFLYWWKAVCKELVRVLKPNGEGFIWCDWRTAPVLAQGFDMGQKYTWRLSQMLYHYREMPGQGTPFRNSVDLIAYVRGNEATGSRIPNTTHNWISKYWYYGKHDHHPAEKDVELARQLVRWCSDEGATIIDPFMGSGTTGVACRLEGRNFIGIEKEEDHFLTAERRITDKALPLLLPDAPAQPVAEQAAMFGD